MRTSKLFSAAISLCAALVVLACSIAVPILFRPFYYAQIESLELPARTGYSEEIIREAYDEMLDFCVLGSPFGTGALRWSESGRSHFADVAVLFRLDFGVAAASLAGLAVCLGLYLGRKLRPHRFLGRGPGFWAGALLAGCFMIVTVLAATDFNRAFVVFHALFFPGKENWIFDPRTDEIINILPQEFFMNCAVCIVAVLLLCCACLVLSDLLFGRRRRKNLSPAGKS